MLGLALVAALTAAPALQLPGQFHGDETVARDGERWLALVADDAGARLRSVRVRVKPVHDVVLDADDGPATGRIVESVAGPGGATIAYVRGSNLREGAVPRAIATELPVGNGLGASRLRLGDRDYTLATRCVPAAGIADSYRCTIELVQGDRRQTLAAMAGTREQDGRFMLGDEASPALLFAGDLDGDGALDLLYDVTDHYNVTAPTLFLSGAAGDGELVHAVAEQRTTGC
ncbi:MAG: hypothetical protein ACTHOH_02905 [Lysobacteraceae bacterium]